MSILLANSGCSVSFKASFRLLARKWAPYGSSLSSLLRTVLILSFKGRFFWGIESQVFLPLITRFCLPSTEGLVVILWKYLDSFLSGGRADPHFCPCPCSGTRQRRSLGDEPDSSSDPSQLACCTRTLEFGAKLSIFVFLKRLSAYFWKGLKKHDVTRDLWVWPWFKIFQNW